GQRRVAVVGLEPVVLVDPDPRELLPEASHLVAAVGQLLLGVEQRAPRREPLLTRRRAVGRHLRPSFVGAAHRVSPSRAAAGGSALGGRVSPVSSSVLRFERTDGQPPVTSCAITLPSSKPSWTTVS